MLSILFYTDTKSFEGKICKMEIARCLERTMKKIAEGWPEGNIIDSNNSKVGTFKLTILKEQR
jgi:hypothetical protein